MASKTTNPVLGNRALNRATLERQLLLRRAPQSVMSVKGAVEHLVGLQAQNVKPPYFALAARLDGFDPEELSALMASREVARLVTMRSTIHTHTADAASPCGRWSRPRATGSWSSSARGSPGSIWTGSPASPASWSRSGPGP